MILQEILNHMTEDELRNYTVKMADCAHYEGRLRALYSELSDDYMEVARTQKWITEAYINHRRVAESLTKYERELEKKYDEFVPKPCCPATTKGEQDE